MVLITLHEHRSHTPPSPSQTPLRFCEVYGIGVLLSTSLFSISSRYVGAKNTATVGIIAGCILVPRVPTLLMKEYQHSLLRKYKHALPQIRCCFFYRENVCCANFQEYERASHPGSRLFAGIGRAIFSCDPRRCSCTAQVLQPPENLSANVSSDILAYHTLVIAPQN